MSDHRLINHLQVGILQIGLDGVITSANAAALRISGHSVLVGQPLDILIPDYHQENHQADIDRANVAGLKNFMQMGRMVPLQQASGDLIECDIRVTTYDGGFLVSVMDKVSEVFQKGLQTRWHLLTREMACTMNLTTFKFDYLSPSWVQILGWSLRELRSKPFTEWTHPDDLAASAREARKLMDPDYEVVQFTNRYRHRDGHWVWLQWAATSDGNITYASARDVSDAVDLQHQIDLWARVSSGLRVAIDSSAPLEGRRFSTASAEWGDVLGWTSEELCSRPTMSFIHPDDHGITEEETRRLTESAGYFTSSFVNRYRHKCPRLDGTPRWVWLEWRAVQHEPTHTLLATAWDITEYKEIEHAQQQLLAELQYANADLERFTSAAAHQLKSPPRSITGLSQALLDDYGDVFPEEASKWISLIRDDATKMAQVVDALYKFSAIRSEETDLDMERVRLTKVLQAIHDDRARHGQWNESKMVWPRNMPAVHVNPMMIHEVLSNLADNAYKYNANEAKLLQWVWEPDEDANWVRIGLKDNGLGLTQHLIDHKLFQLFQRVHPDFPATGHGVGLSTCRYLVMKMGGRIWAESEGPGKGSTFWFTARRDLKETPEYGGG